MAMARAMVEVKRYKFPDRVIADYLAMTMRTEGEQEYVLASDHEHAIATALQEQRERDAKVADKWANSKSCQDHDNDPCCHIRTGEGIAAAIRKAVE